MTLQPLSLAHPLRAAACLFVGFAILVVTCAPFLDGIDPAAFVGLGLGYCLVLAFWVIGFALAVPSRFVAWWLVMSALPLLGIGAVSVLVGFSPGALLALPVALHWGFWAFLGGWLVAGGAVAGWGWLRREKATS